MRRFLPRGRPSPALIVAMVALIAATSGTAVAAGLPGRGRVATDDIRRGAVTRAKIRRNAINYTRLSRTVRALIQRGLREPATASVASHGGPSYFSVLEASTASEAPLLSDGTFSMSMSCASSIPSVKANTGVSDATLSSAGAKTSPTDGGTAYNAQDASAPDFDSGENPELLPDTVATPTAGEGGVMHTEYEAPGVVVTVDWQYQSNPHGGTGCLASGVYG
jgi:hypothetical protein